MPSFASSSPPTPPSPAASPAVEWGRFALAGLGTVVAALVANVLVYLVASAFVDYDPRFLPIATVGGTVIFTLVPAIGAVLVYALLLRFAANPARTFTIVAAVVLVLSFIPDLTYLPTVPGATGPQIAVLMLMHVVAAVVIVRMLTALAGPRPR